MTIQIPPPHTNNLQHKDLNSLFTDIANSIRQKSGSSESIVADEFPTAIQSIPSGGGGQTFTLSKDPYVSWGQGRVWVLNKNGEALEVNYSTDFPMVIQEGSAILCLSTNMNIGIYGENWGPLSCEFHYNWFSSNYAQIVIVKENLIVG